MIANIEALSQYPKEKYQENDEVSSSQQSYKISETNIDLKNLKVLFDNEGLNPIEITERASFDPAIGDNLAMNS